MLVRESISFQRYKEPKKALGLGKDVIRQMIEDWLKENTLIQEYTINNDDLTIDAKLVHICDNSSLTALPSFIKFFYIKEDFYIFGNSLITLEGCPTIVGGHFNCNHNNLTSLKGCPKRVRKDFSFSYNHVSSIEYFPLYIGGSLFCSENNIPKEIDEDEIRKRCKIKKNIIGLKFAQNN